MITTELKSLLLRMEKEDQEQRDLGLDRSERWRSIPRETGKFLYQMVMIHHPHQIVEIGMSHGYSAIWMGLAATKVGADVISYEIEDWRYKQAIQNLKEARLQNTVIGRLVDPDFDDYPQAIDMVFIDAEKSDYLIHFKNIEAKLNKNALIIADNTISHQEELQGYIDYVRNHTDFYSIPIPIGKGLELTRRVKSHEKPIVLSLKN